MLDAVLNQFEFLCPLRWLIVGISESKRSSAYRNTVFVSDLLRHSLRLNVTDFDGGFWSFVGDDLGQPAKQRLRQILASFLSTLEVFTQIGAQTFGLDTLPIAGGLGYFLLTTTPV
jgi:hypothetical protein